MTSDPAHLDGPAPPRRANHSKPMVVKYWSRAGIMLTDWCNASCACCYANCSPDRNRWLDVDQALTIWSGLIAAGAHGCRVHLTGGEVFGRFDHLLAVCREGRREGLGPLEAIETNGFWATRDSLIRRRLKALDDAGMERLTVSADPYHQQFVAIRHVRRLVRVAEEVLGADRVRVRWRDWLDRAPDVAPPDGAEPAESLATYAAGGRDRLTGRAADGLDGEMELKPAAGFDDKPCKERLLRGRHVHTAPSGEIWPATCVGIVVGNALDQPIRQTWDDLQSNWDRMPIVGPLSGRGPVGLLELATDRGFTPHQQGYAGKCQLCYNLRRYLHQSGSHTQCLGPAEVYECKYENRPA